MTTSPTKPVWVLLVVFSPHAGPVGSIRPKSTSTRWAARFSASTVSLSPAISRLSSPANVSAFHPTIASLSMAVGLPAYSLFSSAYQSTAWRTNCSPPSRNQVDIRLSVSFR